MHARHSPSFRAALALGAASVLLAQPVRANGAFPDEFSIHFQPGAPQRILMGANFGLLISEDDGATWRYACEPWVVSSSNAALSNTSVSFYQVTADAVLLADALTVTRSDDVACTWPTAGGVAATVRVTDLFPDPNDASFVLAISVILNPTDVVSYIVASHDGGKTFDAPHLYETRDLLTGVEMARSTPGVAYATTVSISGGAAHFLASADRGAHWTTLPLAIPSGTEPRILAVDPEDDQTVYLRLVTSLSDSILMTANGGQSFQTILPPIGTSLSSFLRAGDGALYAGTRTGKLYVQPAGATGFTERSAPHLRCLGQRPGTTRIYACADGVADGFSLATSDDNGLSFQPMMSFTELLGPLTCAPVQTACAAHWARIQGVLGIVGDGGTPGPSDAGTTDGGVPPPPSSGGRSSGCSTTGGGAAAFLGVVALVLLWRRVS
jgi:uncharacterized protein (TIGR03382 family)